jgi:DNA-binding response OmpR family regulator
MALIRAWKAYAPTYRTREMQILTNWMLAGASGTVVGLAGSGRSNFLGFFGHRPDVVQSYLPPQADPVAVIPVDLNDLPSNTLATLYRVILRSFYTAREHLDAALQQRVAALYLENRATRDPFLSQSALHELLMQFRVQGTRVVLVMDHFDTFCERVAPQMLFTLRGLRTSFKDILCYIVGTRCEAAYLSDPAMLSGLYEMLDIHVCWVGPMDEADGRRLVAEETHFSSLPPTEAEIAQLLTLTGCYPALLKTACHWWSFAATRPPLSEWKEALLAEHSIQFRLEEMWEGLTQEEQRALAEEVLASRAAARKRKAKSLDQIETQHHQALKRLKDKGFFLRTGGGWRIFGDLFAAFAAEAAGLGRGRIWLDTKTETLYQGSTSLGNLEPLERKALCFFIEHPYVRHSKTDLILSIWPKEAIEKGLSDESLHQLICGLRKKIEPNPAEPCYIVTWWARRPLEGGYQFYPEGRPK